MKRPLAGGYRHLMDSMHNRARTDLIVLSLSHPHSHRLERMRVRQKSRGKDDMQVSDDATFGAEQ